ncbi:MAG: hypothetical protein ACOYYS_27980 [Chloroflexota bacterium]
MKFSLSWIIAFLAGSLVLAGYFFPADHAYVLYVQQTALHVAMILAAFGVLAGVLNLLSVHWRRFDGAHKGGGYSVFLIVGFLIPFVALALDYFLPEQKQFTILGSFSQWSFQYLLIPLEASLFALLAVVLAYFAARMLRWRANAFGMIFFGAVVLTLALTFPFWASLAPVAYVYENILRPLVVGGGRGVLLGVALGTIATGIRIFMGAERPYG